jgi:hypothetical protein
LGYLFAVRVGAVPGTSSTNGGGSAPKSPPPGAPGGGGAGSLRAPAARVVPGPASAAAALRAALRAATAALAPLPGERLPIVHYSFALTGHPPLVSHCDVSADGHPDFINFGVPTLMPSPSFFAVDPLEGIPAGAPPTHVESPLRYVVRSEDAVRDIVLAMLASPGRLRSGEGRAAVAVDGKDAKQGAPARVTCKASPVTIPYACLASLRAEAPALFEAPGRGGGGAAAARPRPAAAGGPLVIDVGFTSGGFYGLLAASQGVSALVVDPQPQCALFAKLGAAASGLGDLVTVVPAVPLPRESVGDAAALPAPLRTGCVSTSTTDNHATPDEVARYYSGRAAREEGGGGAKEDDGGRAAAEVARSRVGTEGAAFAGGGSGTLEIPVASLDDIMCATFGAVCEEGGSGEGGGAPPPTPLLVKIDARGREMDVLLGMERMLASPDVAPLNLLVEVNKQHAAAALGLASARKAAKEAGVKFPKGIPLAEGVVAGFGLGNVALTDQENEAIAERYVALVQLLLEAGYEVLVSDRGEAAAKEGVRGGAQSSKRRGPRRRPK